MTTTTLDHHIPPPYYPRRQDHGTANGNKGHGDKEYGKGYARDRRSRLYADTHLCCELIAAADALLGNDPELALWEVGGDDEEYERDCWDWYMRNREPLACGLFENEDSDAGDLICELAAEGDPDAMMLVGLRSLGPDAWAFASLSDLGIKTEDRLHRSQFLDSRDPTEQLNLHDGLTGMRIFAIRTEHVR